MWLWGKHTVVGQETRTGMASFSERRTSFSTAFGFRPRYEVIINGFSALARVDAISLATFKKPWVSSFFGYTRKEKWNKAYCTDHYLLKQLVLQSSITLSLSLSSRNLRLHLLPLLRGGPRDRLGPWVHSMLSKNGNQDLAYDWLLDPRIVEYINLRDSRLEASHNDLTNVPGAINLSRIAHIWSNNGWLVMDVWWNVIKS